MQAQILKTEVELPSISYDIIASLMLSASNHDNSFIQESVDRYKRFLFLAKMYPDIKLVPTTDIDFVWHDHLLHTKSYFNDCINYLGFIFNHTPETNKECLEPHFRKTEQLWNLTYNEKYSQFFGPALCGGGGETK